MAFCTEKALDDNSSGRAFLPLGRVSFIFVFAEREFRYAAGLYLPRRGSGLPCMVYDARQGELLARKAPFENNKIRAQIYFPPPFQNSEGLFCSAQGLVSKNKNILCQFLCKSRKTVEKQRESVV